MVDPRIIIVKQKVELAIKEHKLVRFDYVSKDLSVTMNRTAEPHEIKRDKNDDPNYVVGTDLDKDDLRHFAFEGMQNVKLVSWTEYYAESLK